MLSFEEKKEIAGRYNLIDDTLFQKVVEDSAVCEELIQIILGNKNIKLVKSQPQVSLRNSGAHSVVLDLLCEDETGCLFNVEVQKSDDDDHVKRARYNLSNLDTMSTEKGIPYSELPSAYVIFITKFDIFRAGKTVYHIDRVVRETGNGSDNGAHEIYLNASGKDSTVLGELMHFFLHSVGYHPEFPKLSQRVQYFKESQKGVNNIFEVSESFRQEGRKEGRAEGRREGRAEGRKEGRAECRTEIIRQLLQHGNAPAFIAQNTNIPLEDILKVQQSVKA